MGPESRSHTAYLAMPSTKASVDGMNVDQVGGCMVHVGLGIFQITASPLTGVDRFGRSAGSLKKGCPCTREVACSTLPSCPNRTGLARKAMEQAPFPHGGSGVIISAAVFEYVDVGEVIV